ncbi:MAG: hypothetical protein D6785_15895 [Planctomycetota bacterium]|nr:MAG: hypothetical protein D6785_15895 [Planctomycetota bacterium]
MGLFKSKEERRIERDMAIRKAINAIKKNIRELEKNEKEYIKKAKRAKQINSSQQFEFLKKTLKRTACQRKLLERQLLNIETAYQIKNQAEASLDFCKAMNSVSKAIAESFAGIDMTQTIKDFEHAMEKAQTMEERMELLLDMSADSMFASDAQFDQLISDEEIEQMIEEEVAYEESEQLDSRISSELEEIRKELSKEE